LRHLGLHVYLSRSQLAALARKSTSVEANVQLSINALETELAAATTVCREESLGIEVTAFAFPNTLDHHYEASLSRHAALVTGIAPISLHGPFLDLYPASQDPEINRSYRDRFAATIAEFWLPLADEAASHGITIVLENLWEPGPDRNRARELGRALCRASPLRSRLSRCPGERRARTQPREPRRGETLRARDSRGLTNACTLHTEQGGTAECRAPAVVFARGAESSAG
jgi:hypothetical protein